MLYKACLLDLDNTLYEYEGAHQAALTNSLSWLAQRTKIEIPKLQEAYAASRRQIHAELHGQAASHSRLLYFQRLLESLEITPLSLALEAENQYWQRFLETIQLRPSVVEFLDSLKKAQIKVAIVSDLTTQIQLKKLAKLELEGHYDCFVSSEEAGREKPESAIFHLALRKLGTAAGESFVVGDSYERDVEGALALGMPCFWLSKKTESAKQKHPDIVTPFSDFKQLSMLVESMLCSNALPAKE